jgi:hypothetical protein
MSAAKRAPRKSPAPPALPVPRVRTLRCEDDVAAPASPPGERAARTRTSAARRTRRPKFVF